MGEKRRSIAEIETDLLEAQAKHLDANKRLQAALEERARTLAKINQVQDEFDEVIVSLRRSSIPGTRWYDGEAGENVELLLNTELELGSDKATISIIEGSETGTSPQREPAEVHFAHLRTIVEANSNIIAEQEFSSKARRG